MKHLSAGIVFTPDGPKRLALIEIGEGMDFKAAMRFADLNGALLASRQDLLILVANIPTALPAGEYWVQGDKNVENPTIGDSLDTFTLTTRKRTATEALRVAIVKRARD